jgi:hypothetical protein
VGCPARIPAAGACADYDKSTRRQHYAADIAADYNFTRNVRQE